MHKLLTVALSLICSYAQAESLFEQTELGASYDITLDAGSGFGFYSVFPFWNGSQPLFPGSGGHTLTNDIRFLRVKRISGIPCSQRVRIVIAGDDASSIAETDYVSGVATGPYCDYPISGTSVGKRFWAVMMCIDNGCTSSYGTISLDGSASNPGYIVDGTQTIFQQGGWAFQLCDELGCTDFASKDPLPPLLTFPLFPGDPYTTPVSSIFDHTGNFYYADGIITAFSGEVGKSEYGASCYKVKSGCLWGYMKEDGTQSSIPGLGNYLWYDGHPGYDYPKPKGTVIYSATEGTLCAATLITQSKGKQIWRDTEQCPFGTDPINGPSQGDAWNKFATFYIIHTSGYSTWYLHSSDLDPAIKLAIINKGYAQVLRNQPVAFVGDTGVKGAFHLHFEIRKGDSQAIDPYGWEQDPKLWLY